MDLSVALALLLLLVAAIAVSRYVAKSRRRKLLKERERQRRKRPKYKPPSTSRRSEMRAYDDPSTLAGDITTHGSLQGAEQTSGAINPPPSGNDRGTTIPKPGSTPNKPRG